MPINCSKSVAFPTSACARRRSELHQALFPCADCGAGSEMARVTGHLPLRVNACHDLRARCSRLAHHQTCSLLRICPRCSVCSRADAVMSLKPQPEGICQWRCSISLRDQRLSKWFGSVFWRLGTVINCIGIWHRTTEWYFFVVISESLLRS